MKAALDSSVLIAAYISRAGVCAELLEDIFMHHQRVTSEYILGEVTRKLSEKFRFRQNWLRNCESILAAAQCVEPADIPSGTCRDPNDLPLLGTAVAAQPEVLITVDKDLLELRRLRHRKAWRILAPCAGHFDLRSSRSLRRKASTRR